jgi:hypothetical protein
LTLSCRFSGNYPGDVIAPALASQGNFSETGQEKDPPISRGIPKKSTASCQDLHLERQAALDIARRYTE